MSVPVLAELVTRPEQRPAAQLSWPEHSESAQSVSPSRSSSSPLSQTSGDATQIPDPQRWPMEHAEPQPPQFESSVAGSTSHPLLADASQSR